MAKRLNSRDGDFAGRFAALVGASRGEAAAVDAAVAEIVADVRGRGDEAVIEWTERLDHSTLTPATLAVSRAEIEGAIGRVPGDALAALRLAADRIGAFHARQMPQALDYRDEAGIRLGYRWSPVAAAGLYVPGGTAAYPSSVLMNAVPARVAGVERIVMTVPAPNGELNPLVLAAAHIARIDEVYRIGGAQAIAALAYGTETIAPVDKIVGPGNAYVAAAKRQVFGQVGIDTIAGPSEVLIVADGSRDPAWIALDLLAQAEHDPAAQSILITDDGSFADRVAAAVEEHLATLKRATVARASWQDHGAIIVVADLDEAPALIDALAPEHLQLAIRDPDPLAARVRHAGAIFLGALTPEAIGDYVAGPNHVLPTNRTARFSSGLGVLDFLKRTTFVDCGREGLGAIGPAAVLLAEAEGLDAHARSVAVRLNARHRS